MKKAIIIGVVLVVLAVAAYFASERLYKTASAEETEEGRQYAEESLLAVMNTWDAQALSDRLCDDERRKAPMGKLTEFCEGNAGTLGTLVKYADVKGLARVYYILGKGRLVTGFYSFDAAFQTRSGMVIATVEKRGEEWRLRKLEFFPRRQQ